MAHFNFVISQNAKWGHAGFYIDCHRMTVPENILLQEKHCIPVTRMGCSRMHTSVGQTKGAYTYISNVFARVATHDVSLCCCIQ